MISRKSQSSLVRAWPFTPEPSPPLDSPESLIIVNEYFKMASEDKRRSRPISVGPRREGTLSPNYARPTLQDVLNNRAPPPYTLAAYTAFLSQQHCLETLEFTMEAKRYSDKYDEAIVGMAGMPLSTETIEGFELQQDWLRLLDVYVKPGAPREINLPSEERDGLVKHPYEPLPPAPEALEASVKRMYDLMSDSIFIPFCESVRPMMHAHTYGGPADLPYLDENLLSSRDSLYTHRRQNSRNRRRSPPPSSAPLEHTRSHPPRSTGGSGGSHTMGGGPGPRLTQPLSSTSAYSESVLTDDSGGGDTPMSDADQVVTPPTTPPMSDMPLNVPSRSTIAFMAPKQPVRADSSGWKKMTKLFSGGHKKEKRGSHSSQSKDEPL